MNTLSLMYHDVVEEGQQDSSGFSGGDANRYKLDRATFVRHLDIVRRCGFTAGSVLDGPDNSPSKMLLTFDDGGSGAMLAAQALEENGCVGHFFITSERIGTPGFVSSENLRELTDRGHVVGSHSASHPARLSSLSHADILQEWKTSIEQIADCTGGEITTASVPGGFYSADVGQIAAKCGVRYLFTSEPQTRTSSINDCCLLGRYTVIDSTADAVIQQLLTGQGMARKRQYLSWNGKKLIKNLAGPLYESVRKRLLN